jgi:hypothetical protein
MPNVVLVLVMLVLIMDERVLTLPRRLLTAVLPPCVCFDLPLAADPLPFALEAAATTWLTVGIFTGLVVVEVASVIKLESDSPLSAARL